MHSLILSLRNENVLHNSKANFLKHFNLLFRKVKFFKLMSSTNTVSSFLRSKSDTFWHISEVIFNRKWMPLVGLFKTENLMLFRFSFKTVGFWGKSQSGRFEPVGLYSSFQTRHEVWGRIVCYTIQKRIFWCVLNRFEKRTQIF